MTRREWMTVLAAGGVAAAAAGCAKPFWDPTREQMAEAEKIAKLYVLQNLSDQTGTPAVTGVKLGADGLPVEYPIAFTIGRTPYSRYRAKYWGDTVKGVRVIRVELFDPTRVTDWETTMDFTSPYPGHFTVSVDLAGRRVVDATKKP